MCLDNRIFTIVLEVKIWVKWVQDRMRGEKLDTSGRESFFGEFAKRKTEKLCEFRKEFF